MDNKKVEASKKTPPYLPFKTFLNSLDTFSQGLPGVLDRTIWRSQAGLTQGLLMNTYRFFGLVDEYDSPTEELGTMVTHHEQRPAVLRGLIEATYGKVFGNDLTTTTPKLLEDMFVEEFAVTGATKQKAITFFLKAARFASIPLSPFLMTQIRNSSTRKKRIKGKNAPLATGETGGDSLNPVTPSTPGAEAHSIRLVSGGTVTISISFNPFKMPPEDRTFVFSLIDKIQDYEKSHPLEALVDDDEEDEQV
ncbi:MAG: hypothetical protein LAO30_21065 [Acidobacteriia bacterium]|nr:hypothetical protein [Terriglobia bacterium]